MAAACISSVPEISNTSPVTWALFWSLISTRQNHRVIQVGRDCRRSSSLTCHSDGRVKTDFRPGCSIQFQQSSSWDVWVQMKEETACSKSNNLIIWWRALQTKVNKTVVFLFNPNSSLSWNIISRITFRIPYPTSIPSFMALLLQINFMQNETWKIYALWSLQAIITPLSSKALINNKCFIHHEAKLSIFFHILPALGSQFY